MEKWAKIEVTAQLFLQYFEDSSNKTSCNKTKWLLPINSSSTQEVYQHEISNTGKNLLIGDRLKNERNSRKVEALESKKATEIMAALHLLWGFGTMKGLHFHRAWDKEITATFSRSYSGQVSLADFWVTNNRDMKEGKQRGEGGDRMKGVR